MTTDPSLPVAHNPPADPTKSSTLSVASNRPLPAKANQLPLSHEPTSKTTGLKIPASRMQLDSEAPQPTGIGSEQGFEANFDLTQDPNNQMSITAVGNEENVVANHPSDRQPMTGVSHQSITAADYNPDAGSTINGKMSNRLIVSETHPLQTPNPKQALRQNRKKQAVGTKRRVKMTAMIMMM
ncbi:hypothetical protein PCANC_21247 [Puccinia coronata f. sp. avenae]|uniref:Uncharacterized protein n=1 Tax=Puccinia coronata f. sp. avenae TaxID=200324 RepID=A0A2N5SD88_9BASI|nr:hypothetical protein PCANC_21247 [Puccinia coronata f. sp. avenae]